MPTTRIYTPQQLAPGQQLILGTQASQHLLRVLRARCNDPVTVFNGKGGEYHGKLWGTLKNQAVIELAQFANVDRESPLVIHLAQGVSRGDRMDYVVQKATELGVATITPLFTERCTVKLSGSRLAKRLDHWRLVAIAACEQSGRCVLPEILPPRDYLDFVSQYEGVGLLCDTESTTPLPGHQVIGKTATLLIGPEGGFSAHELKTARDNRLLSLSLGPRILRTETAPVVALTLLQHLAGDF